MKLKQNKNLKYYVFENIDNMSFVKHCFSTKFGGVSSGAYESMNLAFREDKRENVIKNYEIICKELGLNSQNVVFSNQTHEDKIYKVGLEDRGKGLYRQSDIKGYDALITNEKEIVLTTFYADCVPIFLLDIKNKAIGLAHSGWKGTVKEIGKKTVLAMEKEYGSNPKDILVGIGPSIHQCCFEVRQEVAEIFLKELEFSKQFVKEKEDKYIIDLQGIIKYSLLSVGILEDNIELSNICTKCNKDMFFSHRAMGDNRGSMAGIMALI